MTQKLVGWSLKGTGEGSWKYSSVGWPEGQTPADQLKKAYDFFKRAQNGEEDGVVHTFEEMQEFGFLTLLNMRLFHGQGYALAFEYEEEEDTDG